MESCYHLSFGGLPTECSTAGLPAGLSSTCNENQKVSISPLTWSNSRRFWNGLAACIYKTLIGLCCKIVPKGCVLLGDQQDSMYHSDQIKSCCHQLIDLIVFSIILIVFRLDILVGWAFIAIKPPHRLLKQVHQRGAQPARPNHTQSNPFTLARRRANAQLRPVSILDIVRDMAGPDPLRAVPVSDLTGTTCLVVSPRDMIRAWQGRWA